MKDEYERKKTAKQIAKDRIQGAIWGRMTNLLDEADDELTHLTEKQREEVKRHLNIYLTRLDKAIG